MKNNDNSIGTLVIFVALILVAGLSAGVLIKIASALQKQSLDFGEYHKNKTIDCYDYLTRILNHEGITFYSNGTTFIDKYGYSQEDYYLQCEKNFKRGIN